MLITRPLSPRPGTHLQLIQVVAIFAVFHHPSEDQQSCAVTHEAVGGTAGRDVAADRWDKPLVGSCRSDTGPDGSLFCILCLHSNENMNISVFVLQLKSLLHAHTAKHDIILFCHQIPAGLFKPVCPLFPV